MAGAKARKALRPIRMFCTKPSIWPDSSSPPPIRGMIATIRAKSKIPGSRKTPRSAEPIS